MSCWTEKCYARLLIDNHISEDDPSFMKKFDPRKYVAMAKKSGVDSAMVYACCHNGNCYYPTKVGHMHKNLDGRDIFGETVELLDKENIAPVAYTTVIFHNDSAKKHPSWRMKDISGKDHHKRYWFSCVNNKEYVEFCKKQSAEIIAYNVRGIFIDMTFWPMVCRCDSCLEKYQSEFGKEMPDTIDWGNPEWVIFQRARERWMAEFAAELTASIKEIKPEVTVVHQFSPMLHGWLLGQSSGIAEASDYASGDFYGEIKQQRFGAKAFAALSKNKPYEFMTSRCVNLRDHTSTKSKDELLCNAATTLANGGAYFFIDAINPDGTLCPDTYERLGAVSAILKPFKDCVQKHRPDLCAETGLYFSMPSRVNSDGNGTKLEEFVQKDFNMDSVRNVPMLQETMGAATILGQSNIPYKVITETTSNFEGLKTIVINDAAFLSKLETEKLRAFVKNGGTLIATGMTSYYDQEGASSGDFALADVFGVSYTGEMTERVSYLALDYDNQQFVSCSRKAPRTKATSTKVLAQVAEPLFECDDQETYASIHSNPPGKLTEFCGLAEHLHGDGKAVYLYSSVMESEQDSQREFIKSLFRKYIPAGIIESSNAPFCVEITILKSSTENAFILCLVNYQKELPNLSVYDLQITLRLPGNERPRSIRTVSNFQSADYSEDNGQITLKLARLETIEMFEITLK